MQELIRYARALLLLELKKMEVEAQAGKSPAIRAELLLADAGFGNKEIADLTGKTYGAVNKAISRARAARAKTLQEEEINEGGDRGS
jgi:DNA-directed RNA polymerase specialized sigma24 family protein